MRVRLIVLMVLSTSRTKEPVEETKDKVVEAFARPTRWLFEMSRIRDAITRITYLRLCFYTTFCTEITEIENNERFVRVTHTITVSLCIFMYKFVKIGHEVETG